MNNWENEPSFPLKAYVYYSTVETENRYYITYAFFHPRDFTDYFEFETEHENDLEGICLSVYKTGTQYGELEAMLTVYHSRFLHYSHYDVGQRAKIDARPSIYNGKIHIFIECRGHGIKGNSRSSFIFPDDDGVIYKYAGKAMEPVSPTSHISISKACTYDLLHIDELWDKRPGGIEDISTKLYGRPQDKDHALFHSLMNFAGDGMTSCGCFLIKSSPHPPWGWDNIYDNIKPGIQFTDPNSYFAKALSLERIKGHVSPANDPYIYNPYEVP